jgi:PKD repeat protein
MMPLIRFKRGFFVVLLLMICLGTAGNAQGWSNGGYSSDESNPDYGTHDWIANAALQPQTKDITFLKTTYHSLFLLGTEAPDNPAYIGDTGSHHVYYRSDKTLQDDVCADRAASIYASALQYIKSNDLDLAAFEVGVMAHYISDVGVFGHTMGASTDWGAEAHHSDYENGFESRLGSIATPSTSLGNLDSYEATTGLAYKITFGSGTIKSNSWMDANYNWGNSIFEASAMASLYASVTSVAAAINHLMIEAAPSSTSPIVSITSPTSSSTYMIGSPTVNLGGTASDDISVTSVMWSNTATGNSGMASGTASWNVIGILLNEGNNIITVTARDAANNSGIDVITVIYTQSGGLTIIGGSSVQNGTKPLSVSFTCSPDGGAPPYTYHWTFGDGGTSTQQNPSHIYNTAGSFEVVVTVTDSAFDSKQWIREIIVNEPAGGGTLDVLVVSSLVAAIASVNVAAIYLIKRRRKRN